MSLLTPEPSTILPREAKVVHLSTLCAAELEEWHNTHGCEVFRAAHEAKKRAGAYGKQMTCEEYKAQEGQKASQKQRQADMIASQAAQIDALNAQLAELVRKSEDRFNAMAELLKTAIPQA